VWLGRVLSPDGPKDPTEKLILCAVSRFMDFHTGDGAWPSQSTLADMTELSVRTVGKKLRATKWLETYRAGKSGQGWRRHAYRAVDPLRGRLSAHADKVLSDD
jgi:hypothetical protein